MDVEKFFCNPVPFSDGKRHTNPDPFVMRWCGTYYCYATDSDGVKVSISEDWYTGSIKDMQLKSRIKEIIGHHLCFIGTEYFICIIPIWTEKKRMGIKQWLKLAEIEKSGRTIRMGKDVFLINFL